MESVQCCLQEDLNDVSKWRLQTSLQCATETQKQGNSRDAKKQQTKTTTTTKNNNKKRQLKPLILKFTPGTNIVEQVCEHRVRGVSLSEELKWQSHTDDVCKQLTRNIFFA